VVVDALRRRPYTTLDCLVVLPSELCEEFQGMEINAITPRIKPMLGTMGAQPTLMEEIHVARLRTPSWNELGRGAIREGTLICHS